MSSMKIAPSILSADFANLEKELKAVAKAGADWIHVDVMDGHFVNNLTIGIPVVAALKRVSPLPLDVHLMIEKPEKYVAAFVKAGADYLTIHVEATGNPQGVLNQIRILGARCGISLRPKTSLERIRPYLREIDLVLVMTVEPGFGGQEFMMDQVSKLRELEDIRRKENLSYLIEVDGGVNESTVVHCRGADVLVAGSYIFTKTNYTEAIENLKRSL